VQRQEEPDRPGSFVESADRSENRVSRGGAFSPLLFFVAIAFAIYGRILGHEFLQNWDDNVYVVANEAVRGITPAHLKTAFSSFFVGNYAPLHIVSYMLDHALWGLKPWGYLLVNLLLHAVNAFLAFRLYLRLDSRLPLALVAATLFLVHPVQVETVAWVSERKTLLSMLFFLLSLHAYISYCAASGSPRMRWYLLCLFCFVAALLSKVVAVVLPLVLIAHDWYRGGRTSVRKGVLDKIPFFAASALLTAVTLFSQRSADNLSEYAGGSFLNSAMTMLPVFARYLGNIFWPVGLGPIYKPPVKTAPDSEVLLSLLLFAAVLTAALFLMRRRRGAGFALSLFLLGLLPVAHIFPLATLMQDRYLYFPMLGAAFFIVALPSAAAESFGGERGVRIWLVLLCLLLLPAGFLAYRQAGHWKNALTLWSHAAQNEPQSKQAWLMLAITRHDLKDLAGAEEAYLRLLKIAPRDTKGLNGIGVLYGEMGDLDRSMDYLRKAVQLEQNSAETLINFAYAAYLKGSLQESREAFTRAVAIAPATLERLLPVMLEIAMKLGDRDEARRLEALMAGGTYGN